MGCSFCRHPIPLGSSAAHVHNLTCSRTGERSYFPFNDRVYAERQSLTPARRPQITPEEEARIREAMWRNRRPRALSVAVTGVLIG